MIQKNMNAYNMIRSNVEALKRQNMNEYSPSKLLLKEDMLVAFEMKEEKRIVLFLVFVMFGKQRRQVGKDV